MEGGWFWGGRDGHGGVPLVGDAWGWDVRAWNEGNNAAGVGEESGREVFPVGGEGVAIAGIRDTGKHDLRHQSIDASAGDEGRTRRFGQVRVVREAGIGENAAAVEERELTIWRGGRPGPREGLASRGRPNEIVEAIGAGQWASEKNDCQK